MTVNSVSKQGLWGAALVLMAGGLLVSPAQAQAPGAPRTPGQNPNGMRVFLWTGLKTHGPGLHDYPQFLADWSKLLTDRGAVVNGALHPPTREDLDKSDVVVIYKGDVGYLTDSDKASLEAFIQRGGGLVSLHDALCGPDPASFAKMVGGGKKHGEVNFTLDAPVSYTVVDKANPIMKDMSGLTLLDESFFNITWASDPAVHVLATAEIAPTRSAGDHKGEKVPQVWTYEHPAAGGQTARAFVWMQGHTYANFSNYQIQRTLLRGIAWAAKKPVDELVDYVAPPRPVRPEGAPRGQPVGFDYSRADLAGWPASIHISGQPRLLLLSERILAEWSNHNFNKIDARFDNSANNSLNPDPTKPIRCERASEAATTVTEASLKYRRLKPQPPHKPRPLQLPVPIQAEKHDGWLGGVGGCDGLVQNRRGRDRRDSDGRIT